MYKVKKKRVQTLEELQDGVFYRVGDLQAILKNKQLNFSIFSIRDAESWVCTNKECGERSLDKVSKCTVCGSPVKEPVIHSPRTIGDGIGAGHRRYTAQDIRKIVDIFSHVE